MQRFNLLLVNTPADTGRKVRKAIAKVFRRNFVFEVLDLQEADELLQKLNIDLIMVDLDIINTNLSTFTENHPNSHVWAIATRPNAVSSAIHPERNRIFSREDLLAELVAELKSVKKGAQSPSNSGKHPQPRAVSSDFKDFVKVIPTTAR
jgi:hypothetical protein